MSGKDDARTSGPAQDPVGQAVRAQRFTRQAQHASSITELAFNVGRFLRASAPKPAALTARTGVATNVLRGIGAGDTKTFCNLPAGVLSRVLQVCGLTLLQAEAVVKRRDQLTGVVAQPQVVLPREKLNIDVPADVARVLARVQEAAGLSILDLSRATGIRRSQLYYLTDPERGALPRKQEQLHTFLSACGLTVGQIDHILRQWKDLRRAPGKPDVAGTVEDDRTTMITASIRSSENSEVLNSGPVGIRLLGAVALLDNGRQVRIGGPGVRGVLAVLALKVNKVVALDEIVDALWGHDPPATARTIVHGNVSHLRRVLRGIQGDHPDGAQIRTAPPGYQLTVEPDRIDVHRARSLLERASTEEPEKASELLAEALSLWQGPALAGVPSSVRAPELEDLRLAVHGARVDADLELGRHAELIVELSPLVRTDPLAERTAGQLMIALHRAGRRGEALELYRTVSRATLDALGVEPGADLRWLHDRLLNDDLPEGVIGAAVRTANQGTVMPWQLPPAESHLVGREAELARLDELAVQTEAGDRGVCVITGTAGVGKSSLAIAWAHRAAHRFPDGVLVGSMRGFDSRPPRDPAEVLTQFLIGLGVSAERIPEQIQVRSALYRSIIAGRRMLVILDNVRSAEQIRPLLPPGSQTMTLVTSRAKLTGLTVSDSARPIPLSTLAPEEAIKLLERLAGRDEPKSMAALAQLCAYLPLALRIAGARLASNPLLSAQDLVDELGDEHTRLSVLEVEGPSESIRAVFDISFRSLPPNLADTFLKLGAARVSVVGSHLTAAITGLTVAEAQRNLRELAGYSLLEQRGRDAFAFHDLIRWYLHALVTEELGTEQDNVLDAAVNYYLVTGDLARRQLLRVVDPLNFTTASDHRPFDSPPVNSFSEARDWFTAEWPNIISVLAVAQAAGRHDDVWRLARIAHTYRAVYPMLDEWTHLIELGLRSAESAGDAAGHAWMLLARCALSLTFELPPDCLSDADHALELASTIDDHRLTISATIHRGAALTQLGRHDEAIMVLRQAAEETGLTGDLELRGLALNNCAEAERRAGRFIEAIGHQYAALEIDRTLGDGTYIVVSLNNLADLSVKLGELAAAEDYVAEAIDIAINSHFRLQEGILRLTLGRVLRAKNDESGAREQLTLALKICEDNNLRLVETIQNELADIDATDPEDRGEPSGWR